MSATVLVTGVSRHLGARVARALAVHPDTRRVIGLDVVAPSEDLGRAEFVRADLRNPMVARLLEQSEVDTVVHLALSMATARGRTRASQKEDNVMGTMQLLASCRQVSTLRRFVLKSTSAVYGASPHDPAKFTETQTAPRARANGPARDALDVEGYLRDVARKTDGLETVILRPAHIVGRHMSSPLLDYLRLPVVPVPLGYDGRLQFLHEDDAVAAIVTAATGRILTPSSATTAPGASGVINIAADGVLSLHQAIALAGRPWVPMPTRAPLGLRFNPPGRPAFDAGDFDYLRYGRVLDTTRARERLGFEPAHTTRSAFLDAVGAFPPGLPGARLARRWVGAALTGVATDAGAQSGVPAGAQSGVPAVTQSGVPAGAQSGVPAGAQSGVPAGAQADTGTQEVRS